MTYPTNPIYKLFTNLEGTVSFIRKKDGDFNITIPFDEANTDYQEYLAWVAEGNTAEEAD